jgi:hypothetical protein
MSHLDSGVVEGSVADHAESLHHCLGRRVEDGSHRPNHRQCESVEPHVERRPRRLRRVPPVPCVPGESPADLLISGARNTVRHGVEPCEANEVTGGKHLERPESESLLVEALLEAVDESVTFCAIQRGFEVAHDFGVSVESSERRPVRIPPAPHQQTLGTDLLPVPHPGKVVEPPTAACSRTHDARFCADALGLLGLRIFEAIGADIADVSEEHGHRVLRVVGKGGKVAQVPLPPAVGRAIDRAVDGRLAGPILRTHAEVAGVKLPGMHPHMLRHTFVTTTLDADVDLRDVQIAARHADPHTTMRYDRARTNLDKHPNYVLGAFMASGT